MPLQKPALFLDRDGVLNVDRDYVHRVDQFEWIPGAIETVKRANATGWYVFVVTNQSGIARGLYPEDDVIALHEWMTEELAKVGAHIDRIEYCPFHADGTVARYRKESDRRKPAPGMLLDCLKAFPVDRARSFLIGDKPADIAAAEAAGIPGYLFTGGNLLDFAAPLMAERAANDASDG